MKNKFNTPHHSGKRKLTTAVSATFGRLIKIMEPHEAQKKISLPVSEQIKQNDTGINFFGLLLFALIWFTILIMIFRF